MAEDEWLRGDWMQTYTGRRFYPLDPRPEEVDPADIAHALSLLCRFGGHVDRVYSVAEHCVLMSEAVAPEHALAALLHDATEAYVVDVPRPVKRNLEGYAAIEAAVWVAIATRFIVNVELPPEVHEADNRILLDERTALMPRAERWNIDDQFSPLGVTIEGWPPALAEQRYLARLRDLTGEPDVIPTEPVTQEAQRLVHGPRGADYGHPIDDFGRTGKMWGAILGTEPVPPDKVALCMIAVKVSREVNAPKRDNRVDIAGYAETLQMVRERQGRP
jgi:5'-nucleotidase